LNAGAAHYRGIDGSTRMVEAARRALAGTKGEAVLCDIEDLAEPAESFDLVISRMALHYVADLGPVLRACRACLVPGGRLVLTVVHPVITSSDARESSTEPRQSWVVDDYFDSGPRDQQWLGTRTVWHHRTIEDYISELRDAGFALVNLRECAPHRERFDDDAEFERRRRIPLVLLLAGARASI
jgi:SAM-dependent methyltransferase